MIFMISKVELMLTFAQYSLDILNYFKSNFQLFPLLSIRFLSTRKDKNKSMKKHGFEVLKLLKLFVFNIKFLKAFGFYFVFLHPL